MASRGERPERERWLLGVQAIFALALGVFALALPSATLSALVLLFGAFVLIHGVIAIVGAFGDGISGLRLAAGVFGLVVALIALFWPGLTALAILYLIAAWAIVSGAVELLDGVRARFVPYFRWSLVLSGLVSLAFGLLLAILRPAEGLVALIWLIGLYLLVNGLLWGFQALRGGRTASKSSLGQEG